MNTLQKRLFENYQNIEHKLVEGTGKALVITDIQPAYQDYITFDISEFTTWLNKNADQFTEITFLYNGSDLGYEDDYVIQQWLVEHGLDEHLIGHIDWFEKNYGFFRAAMDNGAEHGDIVDIITFMIDNDITDSREIVNNDKLTFELEEFSNKMGVETLLEDGIYIPHDLLEILKNVGNTILNVGGGKDECLAEVEIIQDINKQSHSRINEWIY